MTCHDINFQIKISPQYFVRVFVKLSGAERHVRKESHDCSLGLCIGCKERHDSTFGQSIDPKERHVCTDWLFSVHKIIPKFGYDPKERHDYTLLKRLGPKESHGTFYW